MMDTGLRPDGIAISIVICTDGRADALATTLTCLQHLDGPDFEVCVVHGPTEDGTSEVLAGWAGKIKIARNPVRNLSISRNIGIRMSGGEIIAFIDDDGLPEAVWLEQLICAFDDPRVGGAGGIVYDSTGARIQYYYSSANRLGQADWQRTTPADSFNFPLSFNFPYVQGTNCAFRRVALQSVGGFDEEFEFYLDETDVCCRLVDGGWLIRQLPDAPVHHKFLPSAIRTADRVTHVLYSVLKNKLYFSIVNNRGHYGLGHVAADMLDFVRGHEADIRHHIECGRLSHSDMDVFNEDVERAWSVGLERGIFGGRRLMSASDLPNPPALLPFERLLPAGGRETIVLVSQEYPPLRIGGIGRFMHQLARSIANLGHHVHVLTTTDRHETVDFEDRVWVHRLIPNSDGHMPEGLAVPPKIWSLSARALDAALDIANRQHISAVIAPIWDCEGLAFLLDGRFPLITSLQTTLSSWLEAHPHRRGDPLFKAEFVTPMLEAERLLFRNSQAIWGISRAIVDKIESDYRVEFDCSRLTIIPLGLEDWSIKRIVRPEPVGEGGLRVLFVGRLEERKGIDVLLQVLVRVLRGHTHVYVDIVGNTQIVGRNGKTYQDEFTDDGAAISFRDRVVFHGEVSDEELRGFYEACDIFVAPSRFESFGLMLVEAMMFGKPSIACRTGGMVEVAEDGLTALLAEPGDEASLEACLVRLIVDAELRDTMGKNARRRYEAYFKPDKMASDVIELVRKVASQNARLHA
jgi:glycogen synthase